MKSIWKFELDTSGKIEMPRNAKILSLQTQNETPCIWAEVETENETEQRTFEIFGTGHPLPKKAPMVYIGTFQLDGGSLVFHVYETTI